MPVADLAGALLDEPRWVETRWLLRLDGTTVTGLTGDRRHFVAVNAGAGMLAVVGRPEREFIAAAAAQAPGDTEVLAAAEHGDWVAGALPGWQRVRAHIQRWPDARPLPAAPPAEAARLLTADEIADLHHVPRALREEIQDATADAPVAGAFTGGLPVSWCYAASFTETLWDVSIDTLAPYRRRGLATLAFAVAAAHFGARGRRPVWGAADSNPVSMTMAAKLGFVTGGDLALFAR